MKVPQAAHPNIENMEWVEAVNIENMEREEKRRIENMEWVEVVRNMLFPMEPKDGAVDVEDTVAHRAGHLSGETALVFRAIRKAYTEQPMSQGCIRTKLLCSPHIRYRRRFTYFPRYKG